MLRLSNFILVFMWMGAIWSERVIHSRPRLTDLSKVKQSYIAWPANIALSLKCKADGATPLNVRWYKDGKRITSSANILQDQKWNLKFRKPQLSDNGIYTCVVSNDYGTVRHNYSLRILQRIQSPPVLVPGYPKPVTARVGDNVELECVEQPNGQVSDYRWLKTDSLVENNLTSSAYKKGNVDWLSPQKYKPFALDNDETKLHGVKLRLRHVTESDSGYYTCFLSNHNGFTHGTTFLNITPILPTDPPEFLIPKHKRDHFVVSVEEEDIRFSCLVRGGAPLKYQWFKNGRLLESDEEHEILESEMVLRHVQLADNGVYTCKIRNDYGHVKHSFKLKVLSQEPMFPNHPVLLPGYPKDKTAMIGDTENLYCADTTESLADYRWLKWNKSVTSITKADLLNATMFTILHPKYYERPSFSKRGVVLKLKNLTMADEGLYTCLVTSYRGFAYRSAFLTLQYPVQENPSISMSWVREETTATIEITPTEEEEVISNPIASRRCFNYQENLNGEDTLTIVKTQCETTAACATIYDEHENEKNMFCDEHDFCAEFNITSGECGEVTLERDVLLCCCNGELCNQRGIKLFQKTKKAPVSSSRPKLMPVIFFLAVVLTLSVMLALLGYRLRQRKAALKESIVHKIRPSSRKMTKQKVMETRWLKEDI